MCPHLVVVDSGKLWGGKIFWALWPPWKTRTSGLELLHSWASVSKRDVQQLFSGRRNWRGLVDQHKTYERFDEEFLLLRSRGVQRVNEHRIDCYNRFQFLFLLDSRSICWFSHLRFISSRRMCLRTRGQQEPFIQKVGILDWTPAKNKRAPLIMVWFERNKSENKGLISADRRTKPTLMLTIPHSYRVVYNGFIFSNVENCDKIRCWARRPTRMRVTSEKVVTSLSSMDSDLEAFSHNPTDGSFAALAVQPTALPSIWTNGSSRTKLDYCRDIELISRVKLTCLTTV